MCLAIAEIQIKTALRFHLSLVRGVAINKTNSESWRGIWWRLMHHSLWVKVWMDRATLETIVQVFKEIVLPTVLPFMPLLGTNPNDCMSYHRYIGMSMFITALFVIARKWNHARCTSVDKWITRIWCQNTTGLPSTTKKDEIRRKRWNWWTLHCKGICYLACCLSTSF